MVFTLQQNQNYNSTQSFTLVSQYSHLQSATITREKKTTLLNRNLYLKLIK